MKARRCIRTLAAVAIGLGLAGCPAMESVKPAAVGAVPPGHASAAPNEDGQLCGEARPRAGEVYLQVAYDGSGMPVVDPARCRVHPGARITWRGPDGSRTPFEIAFKAASPAENGQGRIVSSFQRDRSKAAIMAGGVRGSYAYSVLANGKELDPEIIIDPR
ncbi:hypothetical protein [Luteimonas vadosa]|uniref:Uncharacterized protein n=1 Tax=Luteimonas vadosa TaxID=1165507 RepID=A0ABP9E2V8_9GAMM